MTALRTKYESKLITAKAKATDEANYMTMRLVPDMLPLSAQVRIACDIPRRGLRTHQSVEFADAEHFKRWCDNDPIRFEHPLLHVNLKRDADELWRSSDASEP